MILEYYLSKFRRDNPVIPVRKTIIRKGFFVGEIEISIIVPVYNEKINILPLTKELLKTFGNLASELEILYVDDNSPDGTPDEILRVSKQYPQVQLAQHGNKEGIGAAHHYGYGKARGKYILCIDADFSQSSEDLLKIKQKLDEGYDLVIGSRYMERGEQIGKSHIRDLGSRGMNFISKFFLGIRVADATHTFRGFRRSVFETIAENLNEKGHPGFQIQFTFWSIRNGFKITEIPIRFIEREEGRGQSKISVRKEVPRFFALTAKLFCIRVLGAFYR